MIIKLFIVNVLFFLVWKIVRIFWSHELKIKIIIFVALLGNMKICAVKKEKIIKK
jgi:hypothetical protein